MADACQALGAATLWTIQRFAAKAPEAEQESGGPAAAKWRFLPSVGTWVLPKPISVAPPRPTRSTPKKVAANSPQARKAPVKTTAGPTKQAVTVPSPKIEPRRPRYTAPAVSGAAAKAATQTVPSLTKKTVLTKSASATLTRSDVQVAPPSTKTSAPQQSTQKSPRIGSPPVPRVASSIRLGGKTLSTAELEAQRIEEKRKQARFLAERNARRMNRMADAPRAGTQKKDQVPSPPAPSSPPAPPATSAPAAATPPNSAPARLPGATRRVAKPVTREVRPSAPRPVEPPADPSKVPPAASKGARIATAPTPTRNARILPQQRKSQATDSQVAAATKGPSPAAKTAPLKSASGIPRTAPDSSTKQPKMRPPSPGAGVKKAPVKGVQAPGVKAGAHAEAAK